MKRTTTTTTTSSGSIFVVSIAPPTDVPYVFTITALEEGVEADECLVQLLQLLVQDVHLHTKYTGTRVCG